MVLKCLPPTKEVLNPVFKGLMPLIRGVSLVSNSCLSWVIFDIDLTTLWTSLLPAPHVKGPLNHHFTSPTPSHFLLPPSSSSIWSLLRSSSCSHQEDDARGSLLVKSHARLGQAELGYEMHRALSWRFDQSLLGLQLQFQLNINGEYLFICPWKHQEINTNPTQRSEMGGETSFCHRIN